MFAERLSSFVRLLRRYSSKPFTASSKAHRPHIHYSRDTLLALQASSPGKFRPANRIPTPAAGIPSPAARRSSRLVEIQA
ncbi:hypothetical protein CROQUDRAFT_95771 [Cronartium quercuum f. sp. fusiforme G11]|uniref:Uncharacterized protein n=1 Tax=Cronartium quercuum f. sp. fusiforme G11 TaxID=708437 RepID=A0A9P6TAQ1_9BASI|nr:hypothetical protein CROQUDRAFT_95771 [Cronartium quercuum f. sp. fusiforme G11]